MAGRSHSRAVQAVLLAVIVGGLFYLRLVPAPSDADGGGAGSGGAATADSSPVPQPTLESGPDGVAVARFDMTALRRWSAARGLPDPPDVSRCEPALAASLTAALQAAADQPSATSLGSLGAVLASLDARRGAEVCFRRAAASDPQEMRWPYHVGCLAQEAGRTEEAIDWLTRALSLDPDYPMTHGRLAHLLLEVERDDEAAQHLERYVALRPDDSLGYVGQGRLALRQGRLDQAVTVLKTAVARGAFDFQAHYYLGTAYSRLGDAASAQRHLERSRELPQGQWFALRDPLDQQLSQSADSAQHLVNEFERQLDGGDWPTLARLAEGILQRRARDTLMMANLADIYRKLKRYADAHKVLNRAEALAPGNPGLSLKRAALFLAEGDSAQALAAAEASLAQDDKNPEGWDVRARALFVLQRPGEAEMAARQAVQLAPDDAAHLLLLAHVLESTGQRPEARATYARVLELAPGQPTAAAALARLGGG